MKDGKNENKFCGGGFVLKMRQKKAQDRRRSKVA